MIESSGFFLFERSWSEESLNLDQSKNLQPFFVHVGLISPLIRPQLLLTKNVIF
jgi:hypothetical protein